MNPSAHVIAITGGSRGIGAAVAQRLTRDGDGVLLGYCAAAPRLARTDGRIDLASWFRRDRSGQPRNLRALRRDEGRGRDARHWAVY